MVSAGSPLRAPAGLALALAGRVFLLAGWVFLLACSPANTPSAEAPAPLQPTDTLLELEGATPEAPARFAFELDEPRHVTIRDLLSPVKIHWKVRDANGSKVSTRGRPLLPPGRYTVTVTPASLPEGPLILKVLTAPDRNVEGKVQAAADRNDVPERAVPVAPDRALILSESPDQAEHWFAVETSEPGVLLARVEGGTASLLVEIYEPWDDPTGVNPRKILGSASGAHTVYRKVEPGSYEIRLRGAEGVNPAPGAVLRVMHRTPDERATGGIGIMTIGMGAEEAQNSSLGRIAEATGLPLISTQDADDILWVLATAIGEELGADPLWALPGFLGATGLLGTLAVSLRRRRVAIAEGSPEGPGDRA